MTLQKDIKAKGFQSDNEEVFVNLIFTAAHFESKTIKFLRKYQITPEQYNVLRILRGQHPNSIVTGDLQDRMLHNMSNTTRLLDRLVKKEYVERVKNPEDKRKIQVSISDKGLNFLLKIEKDVLSFVERVVNLPSEKLKLLSQLLDELRYSE